jgi:hypothetical protein
MARYPGRVIARLFAVHHHGSRYPSVGRRAMTHGRGMAVVATKILYDPVSLFQREPLTCSSPEYQGQQAPVAPQDGYPLRASRQLPGGGPSERTYPALTNGRSDHLTTALGIHSFLAGLRALQLDPSHTAIPRTGARRDAQAAFGLADYVAEARCACQPRSGPMWRSGEQGAVSFAT